MMTMHQCHHSRWYLLLIQMSSKGNIGSKVKSISNNVIMGFMNLNKNQWKAMWQMLQMWLFGRMQMILLGIVRLRVQKCAPVPFGLALRKSDLDDVPFLLER